MKNMARANAALLACCHLWPTACYSSATGASAEDILPDEKIPSQRRSAALQADTLVLVVYENGKVHAHDAALAKAFMDAGAQSQGRAKLVFKAGPKHITDKDGKELALLTPVKSLDDLDVLSAADSRQYERRYASVRGQAGTRTPSKGRQR
jgi:hypothetical protein